MLKRTACLLVILFALEVPVQSNAQMPAEQNMASIIVGLQQGTINWPRFYVGIRQVVAYQTNGTGRYLQLAQLGPLQRVVLTSQYALPQGYFYTFRSFFLPGAVDWQIATDLQGNIVGFFFAPAVDPTPPPEPGRDPETPPETTKPVKSAPIDDPGGRSVSVHSKDEACQQFPDLC